MLPGLWILKLLGVKDTKTTLIHSRVSNRFRKLQLLLQRLRSSPSTEYLEFPGHSGGPGSAVRIGALGTTSPAERKCPWPSEKPDAEKKKITLLGSR